MKKLLYLLCVTLAMVAVPGNAQEYIDSRGRDFWLTFLPNYHNDVDAIPGNEQLEPEHQLYLYIGSSVPTSGTITLRNRNGNTSSIPFTITDPTQIFTFSTFYLPYELEGWNRSGESIDAFTNQAQDVAMQHVHITSEDEVFVYAMNQAKVTSDAFMVLPTDALGQDYMALAYYSDYTDLLSAGHTPSQFAIVATEDNTSVVIIPSSATSETGMDTIRVTLMEGQSYLVQSMDRVARADLTGSLIRADKPIAVFAGHQRAKLPLGVRNLASRDCLIEQMNPIETWGMKSFVPPLAPSSDEMDVGTNLYRVLAAFDSTSIMVDGTEVALLKGGTFYEAPLTAPHEIVTSQPVQIAMYKKTTGVYVNSNDPALTLVGDPFMMLVPPSEQFMKEYRFISAQSTQDSFPVRSLVYKDQFLNVVIPTLGIPSLTLDGQPVSAVAFQAIGGSGFSYAAMKMSDGVHSMKSDSGFGIYVYGYGLANSYGYIGGMSFKPLDNAPPIITVNTSCYEVTGMITDSVVGDTKLKSVSVVGSTNVNVVLAPFAPRQASVAFTAELVNRYLDGAFMIAGTDRAQQTTGDTVLIPGFTVSVTGNGAAAEPAVRTLLVPQSRTRCDSVTLTNYGSYPQHIRSLGFSSGRIATDVQAPLTIEPGQSVLVRYCRRYDVEGMFEDTLVVNDSCSDRPVLALKDEAVYDRVPPALITETDECVTRLTVRITDNGNTDFGLEYARILDSLLVNTVVEDSANTPDMQSPRWTLAVLDPYQDAVVAFEARDSAGNVTLLVDTIPGFTLEIASVRGEFRTASLGGVELGQLYCKPVLIRNYGSTAKTIDYVRITENILFSVPQSQLPLTIPAGEERELTVCVTPELVRTDSIADTLTIEDACVHATLAVHALAVPRPFSGISRCNVPISTEMNALSGVVELVPVPAADVATIVLPVATSNVRVRVIDIGGMVLLDKAWQGTLTRGLAVDVSELRNGAYTMLLETEFGIRTSPLLIHR